MCFDSTFFTPSDPKTIKDVFPIFLDSGIYLATGGVLALRIAPFWPSFFLPLGLHKTQGVR